eukprot:CAMPEP_0118967390 /NCGR_PEP_ID=MMETSP1173-20130426/4776_1 /TAXON_ID=1034831 /ORGANISM="Rhizochromulina marina cf, Strain CCMP1243" /LENGTH=357 /DNA_ID=CAMNT_0006916349 /DNA_START=343 /DNA_END=1416 /DNA_ORIENTATION=+
MFLDIVTRIKCQLVLAWSFDLEVKVTEGKHAKALEVLQGRSPPLSLLPQATGFMHRVQVHGAVAGLLELVQWTLAKKAGWNTLTAQMAAAEGHLELLKWCRANDCPWDSDPMGRWSSSHMLDMYGSGLGGFGHEIRYDRNCWHHAISRGQVNILEWMLAQGYRMDQLSCADAAREGRLEVLQFLRARGCTWDAATIAAAGGGGHVALIEWAREHGCPWDEWTCYWASTRGHLGVVRYARAHGCPGNPSKCIGCAARYGHVDVVRYFVEEEGTPFPDDTCQTAAEGGYLELLQWLRERGAPWDERTCMKAAKKGHLEVLRWARENGCPWDVRTYNAAKDMKRTEVLQWAISNGCPQSP